MVQSLKKMRPAGARWGVFAGRWGWRVARVLTVLAVLYLVAVWVTLPDIDHLVNQNPVATSYIRIWAERAGLNPEDYRVTSWTAYDAIAPLLIRATVYAEDTGYYNHHGVEWGITRRMAWRYMNGRSATGASTITQQLARNLYFHGDVSIHRKIREIMLALCLERKLSKERILELYLNVIEWGEGVWGISHATKHYFEKAPLELDPFECVFLPALLPAPRHELTGANLYRMTGTQRRICYYLYKEKKMTLEEWTGAKRGMGPLEIALQNGEPIRAALAQARRHIPGTSSSAGSISR